MKGIAGLTYKTESDREMGWDLVLPDGEGPHPLVVFIHGGGWISGDRTMYHEEAIWFAEQGIAGACISYRLAPLYPFPAAIVDVKSFLQHVRVRGSEWNLDSTRLACMGNSAGGHLSLMAGLVCPATNAELSLESPQVIVAVSPITNLADPGRTNFPIAMSFLEQFVPDAASPSSKDAELASPLHLLSGGTPPPTLVIHGEADDIVPIEQSAVYAADPRANAVYVPLPGEGHSFTYQGWMGIRHRSLEFIREKLGL